SHQKAVMFAAVETAQILTTLNGWMIPAAKTPEAIVTMSHPNVVTFKVPAVPNATPLVTYVKSVSAAVIRAQWVTGPISLSPVSVVSVAIAIILYKHFQTKNPVATSPGVFW